MVLRLSDGDYVPNECGGFETVSGDEELLQRLCFKLKARRGAFPFLPELGSRLYMLSKEKPSNRQNAARQYIHEALSDESEIEIISVDMTETDGTLTIYLGVTYLGNALSLSLEI